MKSHLLNPLKAELVPNKWDIKQYVCGRHTGVLFSLILSVAFVEIYVCWKGEIDRMTESKRGIQRLRQRLGVRDRETESERQNQRDRVRETESERQSQRDRDRKKHTHTEREREREREKRKRFTM